MSRHLKKKLRKKFSTLDSNHKRAFTFDCSDANVYLLCRMTRTLTDAMKVIAAVAVVGIHATSTSEHNFATQHIFFSLDFLSVMVNQCARFSVPLFIYLSSYGLSKSDKQNSGSVLRDYFQFLSKRLPTILIPYVFFSAIAIILDRRSYDGGATSISLAIFNKLRIGAADYHLYFLVILAQCYLLFPLLLRIARRYPVAFRAATWVTLLSVSIFLYKGTSEIALNAIGVAHPGWHASFVIYWLPYFMLGILHAEQPLQILTSTRPRRWKSIASLTIVFTTFSIVLAEYVYYSRLGTPVDYYNHFSRPSVMLYALAMIYLLNIFTSDPSPGESMGWGVRAATLAPLTFSVYLIHPQVLRVVNSYLPQLPSFFGWLLVVVTTFGLVYTLKLLTNKLQEKSPVFLAGPLSFLQRCLGLR